MARPFVLNVPGWTNSGSEHWQTRWERAAPESVRRVEQADWDAPEPAAWIGALDAALQATRGPVVLTGHSLGVITIVRWATERRATARRPCVRGALLVAPSDVERPDAPEAIRGFAPIPRERLPFPSILVASLDDPYTRPERSTEFARWWGSRIEWLEGAGHINSAAGFGPFLAGERWLAELRDAGDPATADA